MLTKDHTKRISISESLKHPWIVKWNTATESEEKEMNQNFINRLKNYRAPKKFQREVLHFLVNNTWTPEREALKKAFWSLDTDKNGYVKVEDVRKVLENCGQDFEKVKELIDKLDIDK